MPEPFAEACCPAGADDRPDLLPADPVSCGFFRDGWLADGFCVPLPGAGFADGAACLAVACGLASAGGLPLAGGFAVGAGVPEVTALAAVSLLTTAGLAGAAGAAGILPPVAVAVAVVATRELVPAFSAQKSRGSERAARRCDPRRPRLDCRSPSPSCRWRRV